MARITGTAGNDSIDGTDEAERIFGLGGDDEISGNGGDDMLRGGLGDDYLWGSDGTDAVHGGQGDDTVVESDGGDTLYGGGGIDWLSLSYLSFFGGGHGAVTFIFDPVAHLPLATPDGNIAYNVERLDATGSNFDDLFKGGTLGDWLEGWEGNDVLFGRQGDDRLIGQNGNDTMLGGTGNDTIQGGGNDDAIFGGAGDDAIYGGGSADVHSGNDVLDGGPGADAFHPGLGHTDITYAESKAGVYADLVKGVGFGGDAQGDTFDESGSLGFHGKLIGSGFNDRLVGADALYGGDGDDTLAPGTTTSIMEGGAGKDTFEISYASFQFGTPHVTDFNQAAHEIIDVSGIDAKQHLSFNDTFKFIGTDEFSGKAGELRYEVNGGVTTIQMNTNHDVQPEFQVALDGVFTLTTVDFIL